VWRRRPIIYAAGEEETPPASLSQPLILFTVCLEFFGVIWNFWCQLFYAGISVLVLSGFLK
jgi:hypothetical protein